MAQLPQPAKNSLLDLMTPQEIEKVKQRESLETNSVTREWLGIAELGYYYGWSAVQDFMDDVITIDQADMLVKCARKIRSGQVLDQAMAALAGNSTKKGLFEKIMKTYIKDMKV